MVGLWLAFLLAVLLWRAGRQTAGMMTATELDSLRSVRSALEAQRAALLQRIREGESRGALVPRASALGLRIAADSEIVIISAPGDSVP